MLALKEQCLHPETGSRYIKSCVGGSDNSVQGLQVKTSKQSEHEPWTTAHRGKQNGMTHIFVVEFDSVADRNYYAQEDPVHMDFVKWSETVTSQVQAVDFTNGQFTF